MSGRMKKQAACPVSRASAGLTEYLIVSSQPPTGYYVDGVTACSVSRASAGLTEYLIVSSQPPTGYYVDGVTACSVSRASAGLTEYLIVSKGVNLLLNSVGSVNRLQLKRCLVE